MSINYFDLACVILFVSFALAVYKKGFVQEVFSKLSWIIAALIAFTFTSTIGVNLAKKLTHLETEPLLYLISFVAIFVISYVILKVIGSFIGTVTELPILNELNKGLGIVLGLLEATLLIAFILEILLVQDVFPRDAWIKDSKIAPFFIQYTLQMDVDEMIVLIKQ